MRVKIADAKASDLRKYLKEKYGIDRPPSATRASLLKVLRDMGDMPEELVLEGDAPAPAELVHGDGIAAKVPASHDPTDEELEAEASTFDPEVLVQSLMSQGMDEDEAKEVAGLTKTAHLQKQFRDMDEVPYGPGKEHLYVTVNIRPGKGQYGHRPIPLSVNGEVIYVPRGIDYPIRTPYLECLMHAEEIHYEEVLVADEYGVPFTEHRPRKSLTHPVSLVTPIPYDREEAERVGAKAEAQMAAIAKNTAPVGVRPTADRALGGTPQGQVNYG